ncbi:MAG: polysaccharide deacetylase family protein [Granulosicoccus sp.]|nr:polysaccharide deacetylase family protein [Granulosicoccus sp.]
MWPNPRIPYQLARDRKRLEPLNGKPIMVHLAMNIEYWPFDRPMPRGIIPAPHGAAAEPPDVPNYAWVEYGMRSGMSRILDMLAERNLKASAFINAQVADVYPSLMGAITEADWELVGHGWFQQSLKQVDDELTVIRRSLARLSDVSGRKPRAWLGAGLAETEDTPDHLKAEGVEFVHDWTLDDLPNWMRTIHGPMVALPYTLELNDVPAYAIQHSSSDEILKRLEATLAIYEREAETQSRILTFGLHPHIIGVPHIAYYFEKALDILASRSDTVFVTSSEMGDWFIEADGTHGAELLPFNDGPPAPASQ